MLMMMLCVLLFKSVCVCLLFVMLMMEWLAAFFLVDILELDGVVVKVCKRSL